ncbi:cysteine proteinase [Lepidopterella palustris CBS 459.81]|uniref:Ubiquitin carboxyl-terminal hydrolase n=1 Tax=Lepidopterella palustris CBS 459.81 TaxID=1314670 RepID=A0A8E2JF76_9PEZI|nr:cysteine proteinase [Lepidopterella palustris CBS 459.81]
MGKKMFTVLENNPEVMNSLAYALGLSKDLAFYDIYSLHEPDLLAFIPRPVYALLVIIPLTPAWEKSRIAENAAMEDYEGCGPNEPVVWFKQTIGNACGSIGLLHCVMNGPAADFITPGSDLEKLLKDAIPLKMMDRANMLSESEPFEKAHQDAAMKGDTVAPSIRDAEHLGQHFVAFVKAKDGHLWELEGSRKGPLDRGLLGKDEDALSETALKLGLEKVMKMEQEAGGDLRFSCIALAPSVG